MARIGADDKLVSRQSASLYDKQTPALDAGLTGVTFGDLQRTPQIRTPMTPAAGAGAGPVSQMAQARHQRDYGRMTDADAATRDAEMKNAYRENLISQIPGPSQSMLAGRAPAAPSPAPAPVASAPAPANTAPALGPVSQMAQQMRVSDTSVPVIKRIDNAPGFDSPLFTNLDPAQATGQMQGGTFNTIPASSFTRGQSAPGPISQLAAGMNNEGGAPKGGVIGNSAVDETNARFARSALIDSMKNMGRTRINALVQLMGQDAQDRRSAADIASRDANAEAGRNLDLQRLLQQGGIEGLRLAMQGNIDSQRLAQNQPNVEGQQLQNQQAKMMYDLTQRAINGDAKAAAQLRQLSGKGDPTMDLFSKVAESYIRGAAQNIGGEPPQFDTLWNQISPMLAQVGGTQQQPQAPTLLTDQRAAAIHGNPNMTRAQKKAALQELGYQ